MNAMHHVANQGWIKKRSVKECPYWDLDTSYMRLLINCNIVKPTNAGPEHGNGNIMVLRCINVHVIFSFLVYQVAQENESDIPFCLMTP
jgi:hypothetical protein